MSYRKSPSQIHRQKNIEYLSSLEKSPVAISTDLLKTLTFGLKGKVVFPWSPGYAEDKKDFNNAFPADPLAIVYAANYEDIRLVLSFIRTNNLQFCVRSGGHSLAGYSICDGIIIDLSQLNNIYVDPVYKTAYVEPGCTFEKIFPIIEQYGLHMPSGECPTVAVAGFMQGGGYGFTSRTYGLGCDVVLSVTVMLADGRIVMANNHNNSDLFWAIRGGTGGNFGVLLNISYRLVSLQQVIGIKLAWDFHDSTANAAGALTYIQNQFIVNDTYPNLGFEFAIAKDSDGRQKVFFCAIWIGDENELNTVLAPILALPGTQPLLRIKGNYFGVNEKLLENTPDVPQDANALSRSTIIARPLTAIDWSEILAFFLTAPNAYTTVGIECYGGAVSQVAEDATAFIHRKALMDYFCDVFFTPESNDRKKNEEWSEAYYNFLKKFGNGHSYQNYPNRNQTQDFRWAFWGNAYDRLLAIKQKYDPNNVFKFAQSIGPYNKDLTAIYSNYPELEKPIVYESL